MKACITPRKRLLVTIISIVTLFVNPIIAFFPSSTTPAKTRNRNSRNSGVHSKASYSSPPRSSQTSPLVLYFEPTSNNNDPRKEAQEKLKSGFWNALSYTEEWIAETLKRANNEGKSNPYARKELNYDCEMNVLVLATVASIFRRFREVREMGERHSFAEENMFKIDPSHKLTPLRETKVVIVPFCNYFDSFPSFEKVIQAITNGRKNSADLVTDISIEKMVSVEKDWNLNINGASLHPHYGENSPEEIIQDFQQFGNYGEMDLDKIENTKRKNQARRSPYPTLIIELQTAPPGEGDASLPFHVSISDDDDDLSKRGVLKEIIMKLESVFAKSAVLHKNDEIKTKMNDDTFYSAIGRTSAVEEVLASSPISATQQWVIRNDPMYNPNISSFTSADVTYADSAFEFVFSNLAMNKYDPAADGRMRNIGISSRSYLIMPKFVSASATSLEKFVVDVKNIINTIDGLDDRVSLSLMHPEHVQVEKRSPEPVVILQWFAEHEK